MTPASLQRLRALREKVLRWWMPVGAIRGPLDQFGFVYSKEEHETVLALLTEVEASRQRDGALATFCQSEGPRGTTICMLPLGHSGPCGWEQQEDAIATRTRAVHETIDSLQDGGWLTPSNADHIRATLPSIPEVEDRRAEGETCGTCKFASETENLNPPPSEKPWCSKLNLMLPKDEAFGCKYHEPAPPSGGQT